MMLAVARDGARVEARPGERAMCPGCGGDVIAKCGEINIWHWAHEADADCDTWHEAESAWHREWKRAAAPEQCEVDFGQHRADIVGKHGTVIELQHSPISVEEIREREAFYSPLSPHGMIWLFDAAPWTHRLDLIGFDHADSGPCMSFDWAQARPSHRHLKQTVFWDLGSLFDDMRQSAVAVERDTLKWLWFGDNQDRTILRVENFWHYGGWGILFKRSEFIDSHIRPAIPAPPVSHPRQGALL